jgi:rubredoxin
MNENQLQRQLRRRQRADQRRHRLECKICWWVYDPREGDPVWQIEPGTPFSHCRNIGVARTAMAMPSSSW